MKLPPVSPTTAVRATLPTSPPSSGEPTTAVAKSPSLSLSDAARAPAATQQSPLQQASRLGELRDAINNGHYEINTELIAERLLQWQL